MNLLSVLFILILITGMVHHLLQSTINCTKGLASFMTYANAMFEAEKKLIDQEKKIMDQDIHKYEYNHERLKNFKVLEFVPDHLEFNCEHGVLIVKLDEPPLQTYWALPFE